MMDVRAMAAGVADYVRDAFVMMNRYPEVRWEETKTLNLIATLIEHFPLAQDVHVALNRALAGGIVVDVTIGSEGTRPRILFRADVDALPITDTTTNAWSSTVPGKMHACFHSGHAAMLLGAFKFIASGQVTPSVNLRFVWQRAEENPITQSGGDKLVNDENVLEGISAVYALHGWPDALRGTFLSRGGAMLANSDRVHMVVTCTGGHVAHPEEGSNAIDIATDIHLALRGFDTRYLGPTEPCSFVPSVSNAGTASNVRPDKAETWYAARNLLDEQRRTAFATAIEGRVKKVLAQYPDATLAYEYMRGHPTLFNDPKSVEHVGALLRQQGFTVEEAGLELGGEDFAYYLRPRDGRVISGSFWFLGVNQPGCGKLHTGAFNPDLRALADGVAFWLTLVTQLGEQTEGR